MRAAVIEGIEKIVVKNVSNPLLNDDEALVRIKACGICLTDYKAYSGARTNVNYPIIAGHEFSGIIEKVGQKVRHFKSGDEVVASPVTSCGICLDCRNGHPHYCKHGAVIGGDGMDNVLDGAFAEYVAVPERSLYRKPNSVSFEAAALTEPLAASYKGLIEYSQMTIGEDVVIIGAGSMGLLATMIAARSGAGTLILVDLDDWKLQMAQKCGATHIINIKEGKVRDKIYNIMPNGPDLIFESAGPLEAFGLSFDLCRRGTRLNEFGVTTEGNVPVSPKRIHFEEIRIDASFSVTPKVMQKSLDLMEKGLVDPMMIITHTFSLDEAHKAMETMKSIERIKIIIKP